MRRFVLVAAVATALALAGCSTADVDETTRDENGAVTEGGTLGVEKLQVGDCLDLSNVSGDEEATVESFKAVPCGEPHQGEVYLVNTSFYPDGDYPGEDDAYDQSDTACGPAFEEFTGEAYDDSTLDFVSIYPTAESWSTGDRAVVCIVVTPDETGEDLTKTTGSLKA